jgi:hypothetical protein
MQWLGQKYSQHGREVNVPEILCYPLRSHKNDMFLGFEVRDVIPLRQFFSGIIIKICHGYHRVISYLETGLRGKNIFPQAIAQYRFYRLVIQTLYRPYRDIIQTLYRHSLGRPPYFLYGSVVGSG